MGGNIAMNRSERLQHSTNRRVKGRNVGRGKRLHTSNGHTRNTSAKGGYTMKIVFIIAAVLVVIMIVQEFQGGYGVWQMVLPGAVALLCLDRAGII